MSGLKIYIFALKEPLNDMDVKREGLTMGSRQRIIAEMCVHKNTVHKSEN